jgi:hypothetical protein
LLESDLLFGFLVNRYANRAKNIKNKPKINEDPKDAMLREYKEEIARLRALLETQSSGSMARTADPVVSGAVPLISGDVPLSQSPQGMEATSSAVGVGASVAPPGMQVDDPAPSSSPPGMLSSAPMAVAPPGMEPSTAAAVPEKQVVEIEREVIVERVVEKVVERAVEVLPKDHLNQKRALEEYSQSVVEQRNRLGEELLQRETAIRASEDGRIVLEEKLRALKDKVMNGFGIGAANGQEEETLEVEMARKERERRRMQAKLRAKKRKEAVLEAERLQAEQEKKEAEDELKVAREEAETSERRQVARIHQ